jgi:hypothetical protein
MIGLNFPQAMNLNLNPEYMVHFRIWEWRELTAIPYIINCEG